MARALTMYLLRGLPPYFAVRAPHRPFDARLCACVAKINIQHALYQCATARFAEAPYTAPYGGLPERAMTARQR